MKRSASLVAILAVSLTLTLVFQNCGSYQSGVNPLTDGNYDSVCEGVSCENDIDFVQIKVANAMPVGLKKPDAALTSNACSPSTCIDIAGYCNTSGYTQSAFYYQWKLNNSPIGSRVNAATSCDAVGRFRVMVQIPSPSIHAFDFTKIYTVDITMTIRDENGVERENPSTGVSTNSVSVTGI